MVLEECRHEDQPTLVADILESGIVVVETDLEQERASREYLSDSLSMQDALNLHHAHTRERILLAGDLPLRMRASELGVDVHGSIWVVDQVVELGLVAPSDVCSWIERWPRIGRRLPNAELDRLRSTLGCV